MFLLAKLFNAAAETGVRILVIKPQGVSKKGRLSSEEKLNIKCSDRSEHESVGPGL